MKNFAKLLIVAVAVTLIASLFALTASAAAAPELVDPHTLTPASERVLFIKDAPRDENNQVVGELEGDGSGSDANNPFKIMDHESFDPSATSPKNYLQTAFYQATELLKDEGGTIVICGPVYFGPNEAYGAPGAATQDVWTVKYGDKTIKFTSVWDGVDYRETADAKIIVDTPAEIGIYGQSIWENIDIVTAGTYRVLSFNNYATLVGEGVNCYPADEAFEGVAANYISLSGGHRYAGGVDLTTNFVVQSGTYNSIVAGEWGVNNQKKLKDDGSISWTNNLEGNTSANVVIEGTTTVYGEIGGTNKQGADFSGNTTITINGGNFECDINMVGKTGMLNADGTATLKINGGNFANAWSINNAVAGCTNNMPAVSILDFSGWTGDLAGLAYAVAVVTEFSEIKFADGLTIEKVLENYVEPTEPAETEPEATEPEATTPAESQPAEATDPVEETEPEASTPSEGENEGEGEDKADEKEEGGNGWILWVAIAAGVVVVAAIIVVVLKKKK